MASINSVKRVERKYILSRLQAEKIFLRLRKALPGDPYAGYEPYKVRSLYFDSFFNMDFKDKEAGLLERKKIRLRVYDGDDSMIKLELKQKSGENQEKNSFKVSRELAEELERGEYRGLLSSGDEMLEQVYGIMAKELYRPKCVIEYERRAFAVPTNDIRITFDSKVITNEGNLHLFAPLSSYRPADIQDKVILEVKYNRFLLSYIKDLLALSETYIGSYSKYIAGRQMLI